MPSLCFYPSHGRIHRRVWHPAIPTPPSEVLPQISQMPTDFSQGVQQSLLHQPGRQYILPQNTQNSQKFLAEKSLPRMRTDAHRWLGCVEFSHRIHGTHRSFWRRISSHGLHGCPQMVRLCRVLPQNSRISQKLLVEKSLPRISQMPTDGLAALLLRVGSVGDSLVAAWVWQGCHTLLICAYLCNLWENILRQKILCILLSMLKSKCFDHYFHFKLRFYILGRKFGDCGP